MNETKCNYKQKYGNNLNCSLCETNTEETEAHLLNCVEIVSEPYMSEQLNGLEYMDIFLDLSSQIRACRIWKKIYQIRNWKITNRNLSFVGPQEHQLSASYTPDINLTMNPMDHNLLLNVYDLGY